MRKINKIVVHCSDSDHAHHDNIETIKKWHTEERGFSDIGYHYVITKSGKTYIGRNESQIGAHVKGHNRDSIGICLTGKTKFSDQQKNYLEILLKRLCLEYGLKKTDILAHNDLDNDKTCPNFDLHGFLAALNWH